MRHEPDPFDHRAGVRARGHPDLAEPLGSRPPDGGAQQVLPDADPAMGRAHEEGVDHEHAAALAARPRQGRHQGRLQGPPVLVTDTGYEILTQSAGTPAVPDFVQPKTAQA